MEDVIEAALATGGGYSIPDALTINGQPGFLYNYSSSDATRLRIRQGESYQLRVVNACLNFAMYFAVANHSLTVRELDSAYCVPFTVDVLLIAPGQTVDCILNANLSEGQFYMAASVFSLPDPLIVSQSPRTRVFILFYLYFQFCGFENLQILFQTFSNFFRIYTKKHLHSAKIHKN